MFYRCLVTRVERILYYHILHKTVVTTIGFHIGYHFINTTPEYWKIRFFEIRIWLFKNVEFSSNAQYGLRFSLFALTAGYRYISKVTSDECEMHFKFVIEK